MDSLMKADIFFFITSIAVVLVTVGLLITFVYVIRAMKKLERVEDVADDVRQSFLWKFLFKKRKK
jgi:uncharacterized membrane protein (DUF485 family)